MALTFRAGLIHKRYEPVIHRAVAAVMESTVGISGNGNARKFIDEVCSYDCEAEMRKALHQVARQLLDNRVTFSNYLYEPWLLRKNSLRQAINYFHDVMIEYLHVSGQGPGQLLLLHMDDIIAEYLHTQSEGMICSA